MRFLSTEIKFGGSKVGPSGAAGNWGGGARWICTRWRPPRGTGAETCVIPFSTEPAMGV